VWNVQRARAVKVEPSDGFAKRLVAERDERRGWLVQPRRKRGSIMRACLATACFCVALAGCGGAAFLESTQPDASAPSGRPALRADDEHVVKIREFKLKPPQDATYSIIIGPNNYLWFTEYRAIVRMSDSGDTRLIRMRPTDSDPGFLTVGPDGSIWSTTAQSAPGSRLTGYQIMKVRPNLELSVYDLQADAFPSNLVNLNQQLYFGLDQEVSVSGSDLYRDSVASISTAGQVNILFQVNTSAEYPYFWLNALTTPSSQIWLYDYEGFVHACTLKGDCALADSPGPYEYGDNLHPDSFAYSPADNDVYVANGYTSTIYKFSSADKLIKQYVNRYIGTGYTSLTYCAGNIWVTLGPDSEGRPLFGALTPAGQLEYYALPLPQTKFIATAMVCTKSQHLWYLRGPQVGEILSKI
jgi:DNA-binding beta-propeller fold protein YncE